MTKQTTITIETESLLILRARSSRRTWCPLCGAEGEVIALEDAGVTSNLDRAGLEAWLNSGQFHRLQDEHGTSLICLRSLLTSVRVAKTS